MMNSNKVVPLTGPESPKNQYWSSSSKSSQRSSKHQHDTFKIDENIANLSEKQHEAYFSRNKNSNILSFFNKISFFHFAHKAKSRSYILENSSTGDLLLERDISKIEGSNMTSETLISIHNTLNGSFAPKHHKCRYWSGIGIIVETKDANNVFSKLVISTSNIGIIVKSLDEVLQHKISTKSRCCFRKINVIDDSLRTKLEVNLHLLVTLSTHGKLTWNDFDKWTQSYESYYNELSSVPSDQNMTNDNLGRRGGDHDGVQVHPVDTDEFAQGINIRTQMMPSSSFIKFVEVFQRRIRFFHQQPSPETVLDATRLFYMISMECSSKKNDDVLEIVKHSLKSKNEIKLKLEEVERALLDIFDPQQEQEENDEESNSEFRINFVARLKAVDTSGDGYIGLDEFVRMHHEIVSSSDVKNFMLKYHKDTIPISSGELVACFYVACNILPQEMLDKSTYFHPMSFSSEVQSIVLDINKAEQTRHMSTQLCGYVTMAEIKRFNQVTFDKDVLLEVY